MEGMKRSVARGRNPFGAGTVFQCFFFKSLLCSSSRNPFGAGTVFQCYLNEIKVVNPESQSLWSRDGFSIDLRDVTPFADSPPPHPAHPRGPAGRRRGKGGGGGSKPDVRYHGLWQTIALKVLYGVFLIFFLFWQNFSKPLSLKPGSSYSAITLRTAHCALFSSQYSSRFL